MKRPPRRDATLVAVRWPVETGKPSTGKVRITRPTRRPRASIGANNYDVQANAEKTGMKRSPRRDATLVAVRYKPAVAGKPSTGKVRITRPTRRPRTSIGANNYDVQANVENTGMKRPPRRDATLDAVRWPVETGKPSTGKVRITRPTRRPGTSIGENNYDMQANAGRAGIKRPPRRDATLVAVRWPAEAGEPSTGKVRITRPTRRPSASVGKISAACKQKPRERNKTVAETRRHPRCSTPSRRSGQTIYREGADYPAYSATTCKYRGKQLRQASEC